MLWYSSWSSASKRDALQPATIPVSTCIQHPLMMIVFPLFGNTQTSQLSCDSQPCVLEMEPPGGFTDNLALRLLIKFQNTLGCLRQVPICEVQPPNWRPARFPQRIWKGNSYAHDEIEQHSRDTGVGNRTLEFGLEAANYSPAPARLTFARLSKLAVCSTEP